MSTTPIPAHSAALRREYLSTAHDVATRTPTEENVARLIALTQALLRDVTGEPRMEIRIGMPRGAMSAEGA